jgi:putative inorganic carbon (HCO3(-)) transporter
MFGIRDIIVLTLIIASLPVCFFRPYLGILMWTIVSLLNPHRFAYGVAYHQFPVAVAVGGATLAGLAISFPGLKNFFSRDVLLILLLWLWFTLTTLHSTALPEFAHFAADSWFRWQFVSKVLLMMLVTAVIVNSWARLRYLLLVISACVGVLVVKAVPFMIMTGGSFRLYGPDGSMLADNNDLGLALNMTLPMFFFLARTETDRRIKWLMAFLFLSTIPAVFFTYSRGALVGLALVLFLMVIRSRQRAILLPILVLAALFAVFLTPEQWQKRMDFAKEGRLLDDSALSRINAWTYSWNLALDYPLTGAGFEAFTPELFERYAPNARDVHGPHSIYFGVLAEHGFIGLFLYLSLLASCFLSLRQVRRHARASGDERAANYAAMLQLSLLGFMVCGAFLGRAYFDYFFTIVACVIILRRLCTFESLSTVRAPDLELEVQPA